jgi:hypothetical protein
MYKQCSLKTANFYELQARWKDYYKQRTAKVTDENMAKMWKNHFMVINLWY